MAKQNYKNKTDLNNISSAEMTAYYRSLEADISGDFLSIELTSSAGKQKAKEFIEKYNYPLVTRKIGARAGFFLKKASVLLQTGEYDSCISFGSGFSLLTYFIAQQHHEIKFIDTDLSCILEERHRRIAEHEDKLDKSILSIISSEVLDLEYAAAHNLSLNELFPTCHKPVFIAEGIIYFLSRACVEWLMIQMSSYNSSAFIVDYWPENSVSISECFARAFANMDAFIPEQTKTFWGQAIMSYLHSLFTNVQDQSIQEVERELAASVNKLPLLTNPSTFFPVRVLVAEKS